MLQELSSCICPVCQTGNRAGAKFCKNCGKKILTAKNNGKKEQVVICPKCGKSSDKSKKICSKCGFNISIFSYTPLEENNFFSAPATTELDENKELYINYPAYVQNMLLKFYGIELDELYGLLNCQRYLFDEADKGFALINITSGEVITTNSRFEELIGCSKKDLKGKNFISLISELNSYNKKYDNLDKILKKNEFFIFNKEFEKFSLKFKGRKDFSNKDFRVAMIDNSTSAERRWLKKERSSTTKKLFIVARIAEEISSSLELNVILNNTLERVMSATKSEAALIMFMDKDRRFYPIANKGFSEEMIKNLNINPLKVEFSSSTEKALSSGRTISTRMTANKPGLTGVLAARENLLSTVTVPLKAKEEVIGVMRLGRRKRKEYSGKELELLDAIGNHIVIAIKNARLYEKIKEQLKELEEKNNKLVELEDMKEKLSRMLVHDLKNPLSAIIAYSSQFQDEKIITDPDLQKVFGSIFQAAQDILKMVMNLLDISRMEEGKIDLSFSDIDLKECINHVLDELQIKIAKKKLTIIKSTSKKLFDIKGDKNLIHRVLINLIDNAVKYSRPKGTLEIKFKNDKKKNMIIFSVADGGRGIPKEYHEKIFEPFFTIDTDNAGITTSTGIGLSFCKLAIEAHGGKIWVKDNNPEGSKFYFTLPAEQGNEKD